MVAAVSLTPRSVLVVVVATFRGGRVKTEFVFWKSRV
jgi:hypothetical protein